SSRRRHTRFSRDWSSDVCSSDLIGLQARGLFGAGLLRGSGFRARLLLGRSLFLGKLARRGGFLRLLRVRFRLQARRLGIGLRLRSEERRVGNEGRLPWFAQQDRT